MAAFYNQLKKNVWKFDNQLLRDGTSHLQHSIDMALLVPLTALGKGAAEW